MSCIVNQSVSLWTITDYTGLNAPVKQGWEHWSFTNTSWGRIVCWLLSFSLYVKSQWCQRHAGDIHCSISITQWENQSVWILHCTYNSLLFGVWSLPTAGISLILCIPNMDCHCFLKAHESPCGRASTRPASPLSPHPEDATLSQGSVVLVSFRVG